MFLLKTVLQTEKCGFVFIQERVRFLGYQPVQYSKTRMTGIKGSKEYDD